MTAGRGARANWDDDVAGPPAPRLVDMAERKHSTQRPFTEFYRVHLAAIYRFIRSRTPTPQDAEDLVQQVFFKAFRAQAGFRGDESAQLAWLFRIARNETASWYRRPRPESVPLDGLLRSVAEPADSSLGPEDRVLVDERDQALALMVARLSETEQEVIQLRFAAGLSSVEIALVLDCSAGAARQRLHRALDRLREWSSDDLR